MAEYIERTEELALAMNAGARAIEHTWRYYGAVYTKDFWTDNSQEISYLRAAKILLEASDAPAADVAPVVHGRWDDLPNEYMSVASKTGAYHGNATTCSVCHEVNPNAYKTNYCPNCGARMDGEA